MADIRIRDLPTASPPVSTDFVPIDNGTTRKTSIQTLVETGRPTASQAEAEAGTDPNKAMTPLTTKQGVSFYGLTKAGNLAGLADLPTSRSNLGVAIGSNVQAYDDDLTAISALVSAADKLPYATGAGTWAMTDFTAAARALLDDPDSASQRLTLTVPVYVSNIASLKALDTTKDIIAYLLENDRQGAFKWTVGDFSAQIADDTLEGVYIKANAIAATAGAWVRVFDGPVMARWWGTGQSAIQAANVLFDDIIIDRDFAITSTATWSNGKNYIFIGSGKLSVSTAVTLTIRGVVHAGVWQGLPSSLPNKIFDTTGTGSVIGIRVVKPEWWGAVGDGTTDDQPALQDAHDCVEASFTSDGGRPEVELRGSANYGLGLQLTLRPTANINLKFTGAGPVFGTRFTALASFSTANGTAAIRVDGNSDSIQKIAAFDIGNFSVVGASTTPATVGFRVGGDGVTTDLIGIHQQSPIHDIHVSNFQTCWFFHQVRLVDVRRCSGETTLSGAVVFSIAATTNNGFTGDLDFNSCQFVGPFGATAPSGACVSMQSSGGGTCNISGIGFNDCIFYGSQFQLNMEASNNSTISDVFVNPRCQFEAPPRGAVLTRAVNIASSGAGSDIRNIQVRGTYMSGNGHHKAISVSVASSGLAYGLKFNDNFIANCAAESIDIRGTGGTIQGVHCNENILHDAATATDTIYIENVTQFNVQDNIAEGTQGGTALVHLNGASCNWFVATGNNRGGVATTSVNDTAGGANKVVANNV